MFGRRRSLSDVHERPKGGKHVKPVFVRLEDFIVQLGRKELLACYVGPGDRYVWLVIATQDGQEELVYGCFASHSALLQFFLFAALSQEEFRKEMSVSNAEIDAFIQKHRRKVIAGGTSDQHGKVKTWNSMKFDLETPEHRKEEIERILVAITRLTEAYADPDITLS